MNKKKILKPLKEVISVLNGEDIGYFPRAVLLNSPTVEMMESCNTFWPKAHYDAEAMAKLACAIHRTTGFCATNLPWDACVELEALGGESSVGMGITDVPQPKKAAYHCADEVDIADDIFERGCFPQVFHAVRLVKEKLKDDIPVVPLVEGPLNLSCLTIGINKVYKMMIKEKETVKRVLNIFSSFCIEYGNALLNCGGDVIQVSDPFAQGLTEKHFSEMMVPAYRKISDGIGGPVFLHICGNSGKLLSSIPQTGFSAFSFDAPSVSTVQARKIIGRRMQIIGSVPTVSHILEGSEEDVFNASVQCITDGVDLLSPSCALPPEAPLNNLKAMVKAISYYNEKYYGVTT